MVVTVAVVRVEDATKNADATQSRTRNRRRGMKNHQSTQCGDLALDEAVMKKKEIKVVQTTSTHD
jgi:hypothetical protein